MPSPILTLSFILATMLGTAFHLIFGGGFRRLVLFVIAAWVGFAIGHYAGITLRIEIFNIGALHVFSAIIGALIAVAFVHFLTQNRGRTTLRRSQKSIARKRRA